MGIVVPYGHQPYDGRCALRVLNEDASTLARGMAARVAAPTDLSEFAQRGPESARSISPKRWTDALRTAVALVVRGQQ